MLALEVRINDGPPVLAGAEDLGVLTAMVTCVGKLGSQSVPVRGDDLRQAGLSIGGLTARPPRPTGTANEHVQWIQGRELSVGDTITIRVAETERADPVVTRVTQPDRNDERSAFELAKRDYLRLRKLYETDGE